MSTLAVFRRELRESWRALAGWALGVVAVLGLYLPLYPSMSSGGQLQDIIDALPSQLVTALGYDALGTGAGYAEATFFGLMGFLLLVIAGVSWGAEAIAGREERGRLELDLAHGISRTGYALAMILALLCRLLALGVVAVVTILLLNEPSELGLEAVKVIIAVIALLGLVFLVAAVTLTVGAASGRKSVALIGGVVIAVYAYAGNAIAKQSADLEWLHRFSPYSWAFESQPLSGGWDISILLLWVVGAVLALVSLPFLERRDLRG